LLIEFARLGQRALLAISRDLDAVAPFLDPREAVPFEHLEKAASRLGCTLPELEAEVAEWSKALGWNLLEGLGGSGAETLGSPGASRE
jgi:hypothetical protein